MPHDAQEAHTAGITLHAVHLSKRSFLQSALALLLVGAGSEGALADDGGLAPVGSLATTFQTPQAFLMQAFGTTPPAQLMELDGTKQSQISSVFGKSYPQSRIRYWKANGKSAWILEDIGKPGYQITTSGFIVKAGAIDTAKVLVYRESRGEQVGEDAWLNEFKGAKLAGAELDKKIDNIAGATLSVQMMQRMAKAAIKLDALTA